MKKDAIEIFFVNLFFSIPFVGHSIAITRGVMMETEGNHMNKNSRYLVILLGIALSTARAQGQQHVGKSNVSEEIEYVYVPSPTKQTTAVSGKLSPAVSAATTPAGQVGGKTTPTAAGVAGKAQTATASSGKTGAVASGGNDTTVQLPGYVGQNLSQIEKPSQLAPSEKMDGVMKSQAMGMNEAHAFTILGKDKQGRTLMRAPDGSVYAAPPADPSTLLATGSLKENNVSGGAYQNFGINELGISAGSVVGFAWGRPSPFKIGQEEKNWYIEDAAGKINQPDIYAFVQKGNKLYPIGGGGMGKAKAEKQ